MAIQQNTNPEHIQIIQKGEYDEKYTQNHM